MNKISIEINAYFEKLKQKGFFHIFGASTINKIIGFASGWIIVRIISKPEYGIYTNALNKYNLIMLFSGIGITSAVLQLGSEVAKDEDKQKYYEYGLKTGLFVNLLLSIIVLIVGLFIPLKIEGSNRLLVMMTLMPVITIITDLQFMYLRIHLKNKMYSTLSIINSSIVLLLSCILSFAFKAPGLVIAGYCSHLITMIIACKFYKVPIGLVKVGLSETERKNIFSISLISMINNGLSRLMYLLDVFIIGLIIADSVVIASYKVATNIPTALQFIPASLTIFIYPHFAKNKDNKKWVLNNYIKMIIPFGVFNLLVSIFLIVISEPLISTVFGQQYIDAIAPYRILCVSYFFSSTFRTVTGALLVTQRQLKFNLFISILAATMNSILNYILISSMQMIGAAISTLITTSICGLCSTVYFFLYVKFKKENNVSKS